MSYCVQCKHYEQRISGVDACLREEYQRPVSLVTGLPQPMYCEVLRAEYGLCGHYGKGFETKEPRDE